MTIVYFDLNEILNIVTDGDSLLLLPRVPSNSIDCIITDPKYNIGVNYGAGIKDNLPIEEYVAECKLWILECERVLKVGGTIIIIINVENSHRLRNLLDLVRLDYRNVISWRYTFGQAQKEKFTPSHADILYYVKGDTFTFNYQAVLTPSDRQKKYHDKRAAEEGKVYGDVWDIPLDDQRDAPASDVWTFPRVTGNSKERVKGSHNQLPEELVRRLVLALTNKGDIVLDPFCGTGTIPKVAKHHARQFITFERNPDRAEQARKRLRDITDYFPAKTSA
jgi:DNA modification methylase